MLAPAWIRPLSGEEKRRSRDVTSSDARFEFAARRTPRARAGASELRFKGGWLDDLSSSRVNESESRFQPGVPPAGSFQEELIYSLISHIRVNNGRRHLYSATLGFFLRFEDVSCKILVGC